MMKPRFLTKTRYKLGFECPTKLFSCGISVDTLDYTEEDQDPVSKCLGAQDALLAMALEWNQ